MASRRGMSSFHSCSCSHSLHKHHPIARCNKDDNHIEKFYLNDEEEGVHENDNNEYERLYNKKMNTAKVIFSFRVFFGSYLIKFMDYGSKGYYVNVHNNIRKCINHYKCPKWFSDMLIEINKWT